MKTRINQVDNKIMVSVIIIFIIHCNTLFSQAPLVDWQYSYWDSEHPISGVYIPQNESGEDWFYDHKISLINNDPNGYICAGYSTYVEWAASEISGCYSNDPLGTPNCGDFESPGNRRGSNLAVMSLVNLKGVTKWYETYNEGWFYKVIQTSDGGYLGIGPTQSTEFEDKFGNPLPLIYNPNQFGGNITNHFLAGTSCTKGNEKRKACLVKTDKDGKVEWQYIYGMELFTGNGSAAYESAVMGWDVVETPDCYYRFTGCAEDPNSNNEMRAFVIEIGNEGFWRWGEYYRPPNYFSVGIKIEKYNSGGNTKYIIAGEEKFDPTGKKRVFAFQIDNTIPPVIDWDININTGPIPLNTSLNSRVSDFIINSKNELLLPVGVNCTDCTYAFGEATGKLYQIDANTGFFIGAPTYPINLGVFKAYDLKIGITPTADGGFAIASSQQPNGVPNLPITSTDGLCTYGKEYWDTDGYAAKYSSTGTLEWATTFDANTANQGGNTWLYPDPNMSDLKSQECLYSIVQSPDGGFVIGGNNSSNFDDSYLTKLESTCKDLLLENKVEPGSASYSYSNTITAQNYLITNTGNVVFRAGNAIYLKKGFKATNGCFFHAYIDPGIDCTPNYISLGKDNVDLVEINNLPILNSKKLIKGDPGSIIERTTNLENRDLEEPGKKRISNYPNPFSNSTTIEFSIPNAVEVSLSVYNATASLIRTLINNEYKDAGKHSISFGGSDLNPGIYIYRLQVGGEILAGRMVLTKQ